MQGERPTSRQVDGIRSWASVKIHVAEWPLVGLLFLTAVSHPALAFQRIDNSRLSLDGTPGSANAAVPPNPNVPGMQNPNLQNPDGQGEGARIPRQAICTFDPYETAVNTVSVAALQLPEKAQDEIQAACHAFSEHKLAKAEQYLHKALQVNPRYEPGWVMLGKILMVAEQLDQAENACAEGAKVNPESWRAALCLSEIAGRQQRWLASSVQSERALALSPDSAPYASFFDAVALAELNEFPLAEKRALQALELDRKHKQPAIRLVLARIYEAQGNDQAAANQLREFLKDAADSPQADSAKKELALIQDSGN